MRPRNSSLSISPAISIHQPHDSIVLCPKFAKTTMIYGTVQAFLADKFFRAFQLTFASFVIVSSSVYLDAYAHGSGGVKYAFAAAIIDIFSCGFRFSLSPRSNISTWVLDFWPISYWSIIVGLVAQVREIFGLKTARPWCWTNNRHRRSPRPIVPISSTGPGSTSGGIGVNWSPPSELSAS